MEKRKHPRLALENLCVDASDGIGFFQGTISDVSRFGFCMLDLPKRINPTAKKMTVVISGHKRSFKMTVMPKWTTNDMVTTSIGVEIGHPPWGWTEFIMTFEPKYNDDAWDIVRM